MLNKAKFDEESEYLENDDTVYFKMNSYDNQDHEHAQNARKQTDNDGCIYKDSEIRKHRTGISKGSSSKKKIQSQNHETVNKSVAKNVYLIDDEDLDIELNFDADDNNSGSDSSYVDVSIEREVETKRSKAISKKNYSKTFANPIHQEKYEKSTAKENSKQAVKNKNKIKETRFRSPKLNLQKLNDSSRSSESSRDFKATEFRKNRRRSGKIKIQANKESSNEDETEVLKKEYLKLKKQLLQLQKSKSKKHSQRRRQEGNKTQRNRDSNSKKATINPKNEATNSKYVRFQFEENSRRGKTPNHSEKGQTQFKFDHVCFCYS